MKAIGATLLLLAIAAITAGQTQDRSSVVVDASDLVLSGTATTIEVHPNDRTRSDRDQVRIKMELTLENTGSVPLIFLAKVPKLGSALVDFKVGDKTDGITDALAARQNWRSSHALGPQEWQTIRNELDTAAPPPDKTLILYPGKNTVFNAELWLALPRQRRPTMMFSPENYPLAFLQERSPLWLTVSVATWPILTLGPDIDRETETKERFANRLRRMWKEFGYLWVDEVTSEPIVVDFNSAVTVEEGKR